MKKILTIFCVIFTFVTTFSQEKNPNYDAETAAKYGGDQYGMKSYVMIILKTPADSLPKIQMTQELMKGHMENISRLAEEGKLIIAGPYGVNDYDFRGLFILDVQTVDEAKALVATDPAIKAGVFEVMYIPWYGSAAIKAYLEEHDKIWVENP